MVLLFRLTTIAERQRTTFARSYAYCVAGVFFVHFFVNIGMTMGLMPIIGIPLPFISKGGLFFNRLYHYDRCIIKVRQHPKKKPWEVGLLILLNPPKL